METWKTIKYDDIIDDMYEISSNGRIRNKKSGYILRGNNVDNEK